MHSEPARSLVVSCAQDLCSLLLEAAANFLCPSKSVALVLKPQECVRGTRLAPLICHCHVCSQPAALGDGECGGGTVLAWGQPWHGDSCDESLVAKITGQAVFTQLSGQKTGPDARLSYVVLFLALCTLWTPFHLPARHFQG